MQCKYSCTIILYKQKLRKHLSFVLHTIFILLITQYCPTVMMLSFWANSVYPNQTAPAEEQMRVFDDNWRIILSVLHKNVCCRYSLELPQHQSKGSPFITLCLGSIEMDRVISEPCYNGIILWRNDRKMTIWDPRPGQVITKTML